MLKLLRRLLFLGILSAAGYALWKRLAGNGSEASGGLAWQAQPSPFPPAPVVRPVPAPTAEPSTPEPSTLEPSTLEPSTLDPAVPAPASSGAWVEADDGACPISHPVKAKLTSGIFHVPGGTNYDRTRADRCYADTSSAEGDGLRRAKR